jgi:hypothetical protein
LELTVGRLAEALLSRAVVNELESEGCKVEGLGRNYKIDEEDIGILVIAGKEGSDAHLVAEVKVKPEHLDAGGILRRRLASMRQGLA